VPVLITYRSAARDGRRAGRVAPVQTMRREMASPQASSAGEIEIEVSGARIRVEPGVDLSDAVRRAVGAARRPVIALRADLKV